MRYPYVYERSANQAARGTRPEPSADYGPAVRATIAAVPDLLRQAEAIGAVSLARYLGQALSETGGIVRQMPPRGSAVPYQF